MYKRSLVVTEEKNNYPMPQQTKTFRVFISSTFTDMREERRILQWDVFPKLEKFCEEQGAKFQAVDLRWGVNEESQRTQKTLEICLNEISRCQKVSPKPNFLILLGDKYGWQPIPRTIPKEEFILIEKKLTEEEKHFIHEWYQEDTNTVPPEFVLKPREGKYKDYYAWDEVEGELRYILRETLSKLNFTAKQREKYFCSATHQEIMAGALNPPEGTEKPEEHVFVYSRKINGLPNDDSAAAYVDLKDGKQDPNCKDQLEELRLELQKKLKNHYRSSSADWKKNGVVFQKDVLQQFSDDVYKFLSEVIANQLATVVDQDELNQEIRLHTHFKNRATEHFRGRAGILDEIDKYLKNPAEKRIMSLIGTSGSGKSSIMAQAVKLHEKEKPATVFRFIGATTRSSNIMSLLQRLNTQIAREFDIDPLSLAMQGNDKAWYEINSLANIFRKCLALATAEKPITVFLDSLDQLSDTDNARALYWLPKEVPEHSRLIVSTLPDFGLQEKLSGTLMAEVPPLPEKEAKEILDQWFGSINRMLMGEQYDQVISSFNKCQKPIYLKLAFEKSRHWQSFDKKHNLKQDVAGIINDYFDDLETVHTKEFVTNVVCYLLSGKYQGLTEDEILEILAFDEEYWKGFLNSTHEDHRQELIDLKEVLEKKEPRGYMKIPIAVWSRFYFDIEPYLTERDADGVPIFTFFHRQFNEVLRERYGIRHRESHV